MKTIKVFKYAGFGILGVGFVFFALWLIMLLWNALIPELFNGPVLSYWQAGGLFILAKILLSGAGPGGSKRGTSRHNWKSKYHSKYGSSTDKSEDASVVVE
jgi:hypothetical protein